MILIYHFLIVVFLAPYIDIMYILRTESGLGIFYEKTQKACIFGPPSVIMRVIKQVSGKIRFI